MQIAANLPHVRGVHNTGIYVVQKGLLILTTVAAILTCIPVCRFAASLTMRALAFLSAGTIYAEHMGHDDLLSKSIKIVKMVAVLLGIVAIAIAQPFVLVASLAVEIAYRVIEIIKAGIEKNGWKVCTNLLMLGVEILILTGVILASWELIVIAFSVSTIFMVYLAIKSFVDACDGDRPLDLIDGICYVVLTGAGYAAMDSVGPKVEFVPRHDRFFPKNESRVPMDVIDSHNEVVVTLEPGRSALLERPIELNEPVLYYSYHGHVPRNLPDHTNSFVTGTHEFTAPPLTVMEFGQIAIHSGGSLVSAGIDDARFYDYE